MNAEERGSFSVRGCRGIGGCLIGGLGLRIGRYGGRWQRGQMMHRSGGRSIGDLK
jgi:hypothetical protein